MNVLETTDLFSGHLKVRRLTVQAAPAEAPRHLEVVTRRDAVAALVFDPAAGHYLLVEQWRVGAQAPVLELPAGLIDADEAPETALRRELREELGAEVGDLTAIATFYTTPGFCTEQIHLFYTEVTARPEAGGGLTAEGESLTICALTPEAFYARPLHDAKTLVAREWARSRQLAHSHR